MNAPLANLHFILSEGSGVDCFSYESGHLLETLFG